MVIFMEILDKQKLFALNNFEYICSRKLDYDMIDSGKKKTLLIRIQNYLNVISKENNNLPMEYKKNQKILCFFHLCTIFK